MGMNVWGEVVGLAGLLSIRVMIIGIYCLMMFLVIGTIAKKITDRDNFITRWVWRAPTEKDQARAADELKRMLGPPP